MDLRLKNLSYSSMLDFHACPRNYQLRKLQAPTEEIDLDLDPSKSSVTFSYGHAVGEGVAHALQSDNVDFALWAAFLAWDAPLLADNPKQKKDIWGALLAVQKFHFLYWETDMFEGWELLHYNGKPAVELSFIIHLPNDFKYRGFVDAVLRHKETGEIRVLECKTTSATTLYAAQYKNSAQAIGYSIVLDVIAPDSSSYEVLYLPYKTKSQEFEPMPFTKNYLQRALWIRELLLDVETMMLYEDAGIWPMHGESCLRFYRECDYLSTCTLSTDALTQPLTEAETAKLTGAHSEFQISVTLADIVAAQLTKTEGYEELDNA